MNFHETEVYYMKILAIGAHQDDNEFRVGGMTVKWVKAGHEVAYLSLTNGCGGHHFLTKEETIAARAKESAAVGAYLGVRYDVWEDQDDCVLVADLATRKRLIRYIRAFNPDVIEQARQRYGQPVAEENEKVVWELDGGITYAACMQHIESDTLDLTDFFNQRYYSPDESPR